MSRLRFLPHALRTRLLAALMLVTGVAAAWIGWRRFRSAGATFDSGMVQGFLEERFATLSGGVYHVRLGRIHVDVEHQGARVDSVVVYTDTLVNQRLAHPLPRLDVVLLQAEVRGVSRDLVGDGISIAEIAFARVDAVLTFAVPGPPSADTTVAVRDTAAPLVSWTVQLPVGVPQVRVTRVLLQGMSAELRPAPGTGGQVQRVERLGLILDSVRLERRIEGIAAPVVVHDIRLLLTDYRGGWDSISTASVGALQGSFRDSTLRVRRVAWTPTRTVRTVLRRGGTRRERFTLAVDSLEAHGVDWGAALRDGAIPARSVAVHGPDLEIYTDRRLPGRAAPRPRTPILQETLRRFGRPVAIDTLTVHRGVLRYVVHPTEGEGTGAMDLTRIEARLTGFDWRPDRASPGRARLTLRGLLWGEAPVALTMQGPLAARDPSLSVDFWMGPMSMTAANALATPVGRMDIKRGALDSVRVLVEIAGDACTGEARPYYRDLSVRMLTRGGFFSRLAGGARTVIANSFVVRDHNPGDDGELMVGPIAEGRDPWQGFWPFLWHCTKSGLGKVAAGRGAVALPE